MIKVKNLKKNYDDFEAVRGIDFDVSEGEVFGLLGPNGAGKTTTVEILEGLIEPSSGTATISDLDVVKNSKKYLQKYLILVDRELKSIQAQLYLRVLEQMNHSPSSSTIRWGMLPSLPPTK